MGTGYPVGHADGDATLRPYDLKWQELLWVAILAAVPAALVFLQANDPNGIQDWGPYLAAFAIAVARPALAAVWNVIMAVKTTVQEATAR